MPDKIETTPFVVKPLKIDFLPILGAVETSCVRLQTGRRVRILLIQREIQGCGSLHNTYKKPTTHHISQKQEENMRR